MCVHTYVTRTGIRLVKVGGVGGGHQMLPQVSTATLEGQWFVDPKEQCERELGGKAASPI